MDRILDEYRSLRVVCIYDAFYCRVCDQKTPHVELIHHTANNVNLKERPWDSHRLEKGMMCLSHSDIDWSPTQMYPDPETLVDQSFLHQKTGVYVHVRLKWRQSGFLTSPAQDGYRACTESYSIDLDYTKKTKRGEWLGGGYYGIECVMDVRDLPLGNQKALDATLIRVASEQTAKRFAHRIPKDEPTQLEMF